MQRINALPRVAAHALILAFAAFMLLAIGSTGAQASPNGQVASIGASAFNDTVLHDDNAQNVDAALNDGPALNTSAGMTADTVRGTAAKSSAGVSGHVLTSCTPGRDKVRVESNAVAPAQAQLQHSPGNDCTGLFAPVHPGIAADQLSGRTPAALTHLDLGIVRT